MVLYRRTGDCNKEKYHNKSLEICDAQKQSWNTHSRPS